MLIAGQYGVYNIRSVNQLCAVVCVDEQFLCKVAVDCSEAAFPLCRISFKNGCSNEVISTYALGDIGAKAELALDVKRRDRFNNEVYVEIQAYPGDTTIGRFDRVIAELSEVEGVAEVEFPAYIPKSEVKEAEFIARLPLRQGVTADQIVAALGMMEKIGIKVMAKAEREGLKGKKRYGICYLYCRCPEALSAELREKIFGVFLGHLILRKTDPKDQFSLNAGVFPKSGVERVGFNCRVSLDFFYADGFKEEFFDEIKKHVSLGLSDIEIIAANAGTVGLYFTCNKPASMPNELLGILVDIAIGVTGQQRISEGVIRRSGSTLMTEVPWRKPVIPLLGRTSAVCV
jgi:hypothetical protein